MENHTAAQLKPIAKERGVRVYYHLRKVEFIHALKAARLVEQKSNIFDKPNPNESHSSFTTNTLEAIKCHDER